MAIRQEVNSPLILTIGIVSGVMMIVIGVGVEAWFKGEESAELSERWKQTPFQFAQDVRREQEATISRFRPADPKTGAGAIPISQAMRLVFETKGAMKPHAVPPTTSLSK